RARHAGQRAFLHRHRIRDTVRASLQAFIAHTGADELMIASQIFAHSERLRSYEITAEILPACRPQPDPKPNP
ncbi:hypothetical protein EMGBS3_08250, partial [Anaerolineaceae bacterium]